MPGSILGPDQIIKVNATFPRLRDHVRTLLQTDHTGVGLMRVHCMVESFDSPEMAAIFRELSFISPTEKKALVRAAIYELMASEPALFITPVAPVLATPKAAAGEQPTTFTPPPFRLNVNKSEQFHGEKKVDTHAEKPVVTSTHTSVVAGQAEKGIKVAKAEQLAKQAAVEEIRSTPADKVK